MQKLPSLSGALILSMYTVIVVPKGASRDRVNAKVMKDKRMASAPQPMPFDFKRMTYGGFTVAVKA